MFVCLKSYKICKLTMFGADDTFSDADVLYQDYMKRRLWI